MAELLLCTGVDGGIAEGCQGAAAGCSPAAATAAADADHAEPDTPAAYAAADGASEPTGLFPPCLAATQSTFRDATCRHRHRGWAVAVMC